MKTTLKIKLIPDPIQFESLKNTMKQFNAVCDEISKFAFTNKCFSKYIIQSEIYYKIKDKYKLSAQIVVRAISKVVESYKTDKKREHGFKEFGAITYDERILSYKKLNVVSIWTTDGRLKIPMHIGEYQKSRMDRIQGQSDLVLVNNVFYLLATMETPEEPQINPEDYIGVDLGVVNIAVDSTGQIFSGEKCEEVRKRYLNLRSNLQSCGSRSALRHLKKIKRKERLFRADTNHCISKKLVTKAKDTSYGLALEELTGIRERVTVRKKERAKHSSWAFSQLRTFIEYKGRREGVPVVTVDSHYTSQQCSKCGHISKKNRKTQSDFKCVSCGFELNADYNAARNIAGRARVNAPIVAQSYKPTTLVVGY
jgi:putative transposase